MNIERRVSMAFVVPPRSWGPKTHLPVAFIIDTSASTNDIRDLLNTCARELLCSMKAQAVFKNIVELLVIFYNSDYQNIVDFKPLGFVGEHDLDIHESRGFTETGRALLYALDCLDNKKAEWRAKGEKYYQPLLFLLTDGYPDAGIDAPMKVVQHVEYTYAQAASKIKEREKTDKIVFVAAGIQQKNGCSANIEKLKQLTSHPERIFCVSDVTGSVHRIEGFYHLIYESTNAVFNNTPVGEVINQFRG